MASARNPLELLPAEADATEEARALLAEIFTEVGITADAGRMASLPAEIRASGGEWWVLTIKDAVAGAVGIRGAKKKGEGELCWWGLVRARRRLGLGRWMVEKALAHARERLEIFTVHASVTPAMRRAASVLHELGFRGPEHFDPESFDQPTVLTRGVRQAPEP